LGLALGGFFFEQRLDAYTTGFGAEVAAESVGTGEASIAAPVAPALEHAATDEFLLAAV
jgi:hypothetical protein